MESLAPQLGHVSNSGGPARAVIPTRESVILSCRSAVPPGRFRTGSAGQTLFRNGFGESRLQSIANGTYGGGSLRGGQRGDSVFEVFRSCFSKRACVLTCRRNMDTITFTLLLHFCPRCGTFH